METIEYRVRPVVRYLVTKHESQPDTGSGSCGAIGEFDHEPYAEQVAWALARQARSERVDELRTVLCNGSRLEGSSIIQLYDGAPVDEIKGGILAQGPAL